jgi:hypothetical protein
MHVEALPEHDVVGPVTRALEAGSLALAAGAIAADLVSGIVHWTADTWGRESLAFFGPRFLRPFRIDHVNPDDILERGFVDCNGDVALLACPVPLLAAVTPLVGIATGWCNSALEALGVFPALERAISTLTGLEPRSDEAYR